MSSLLSLRFRQLHRRPTSPYRAGERARQVLLDNQTRPRPLIMEYRYSNVHFLAISRRYQRRIVSGVTLVATCCRIRRPSRWPFAARRRRWSSVNWTRRPLSCSRRARIVPCRLRLTSAGANFGRQARPSIRTVRGPHTDRIYGFSLLRVRNARVEEAVGAKIFKRGNSPTHARDR